MNKILASSMIIIVLSIFYACNPDENPAVFDNTPYKIEYNGLPTPDLPSDNVITVEGVTLGRMLFYEKMLSKNSIQSCATCHVQIDGFSDKNQFSEGVEKKLGGRQAMPVFNMAWHQNGFFWDGRAASLREQSLKPIQDPLEMNETLPNMIAKLQASNQYKDQFIRAFANGQINEKNVSLALEQFMFTIISNNSKYDRVQAGKEQFSASEERGKNLFFTEFDPSGKVKGAECFHCHSGPNFTNDDYFNNGLDSDLEMKDDGRMKVTKNSLDKAKFLTPSLRNIALTGPYMHDGRFKTIEEVINHYNQNVKKSSTVDILMQYNLQAGGLGLSSADVADLKAFLLTLSDESLKSNPAFSDPN